MDIKERFSTLHSSLKRVVHSDHYIDKRREEKLREVLSVCARQLDVGRVSIWALGEHQEFITCEMLYIRNGDRFERGARLYQRDCPRYFAALKQSKLINANDARQDSRTSEFRESYLEPLSIFSMLDAPIFSGSQLYGVLCIEAVEHLREWNIAEMSYSSSLADTVSLLNEQESWIQAREALQVIEKMDSLTRLENRRFFRQRLERDMRQWQEGLPGYALTVFGIDFFTSINDNYGHQQADQVLITLAERFERIGQQYRCHVSRVSADTFGFWFSKLSTEDALHQCLYAIQSVASEAIPLPSGELIEISGTIGVCTSVKGDTSTDPIRCAEIAMNKAKQNARGSIEFFSPDWSQEVENQRRLEKDLLSAFENDQFVPFYQPIVDASNGCAAGLEALVRWQHPERGLIAPFHFLPLTHQLGLMGKLGSRMLNMVCRDIARLKQQEIDVQWVSVNLSADQLYDSSLVQEIQQLLDQYALSYSVLELEIVEEVIGQDAKIVKAQIDRIAELGIRLSIDDFGTGYSSLSRLKHLPIEKLKIDKSFVDGLPDLSDDQCIARSIVGLAKGMELDLVAEGVENEQQQDWLINHGCEYLQGYLFSKPVPFEELPQLMGRPLGKTGICQSGYQLTVHNNLFEIIACGRWNLDTGQALFNDMRKGMLSWHGSNWAVLVDASEWNPSDRKLQQLVLKELQEFTQLGLIRAAYILGDLEVANYQIELMTPSSDKYQRRFFKSRTRAVEWLADEGFVL